MVIMGLETLDGLMTKVGRHGSIANAWSDGLKKQPLPQSMFELEQKENAWEVLSKGIIST